MRLKRHSSLSVVAIALMFSGCASFEPGLRFQDLMRARQPTVKEARDGLEVAIEEFATTNKSLMAFDGDIAPYGVLALLIRVENKGAGNYNVQKNDIKAFLRGHRLPLLSGVEAANQAATSEYAGKALAWTVATGPFFILLWPATIAGSASHTQSVNRRIQQHFESVELTDSLLRPNQMAVGFLYFKLPDNVKSLENLTLEIEPVAEQTSQRLSYKLSLPTLNLSGPVSTPLASTTEPKQGD